MAKGMSWSMATMADLAPRDVFGKVLIEIARENEKIVAISPDVLVSTRLKDFAREFPRRFSKLVLQNKLQ